MKPDQSVINDSRNMCILIYKLMKLFGKQIVKNIAPRLKISPSSCYKLIYFDKLLLFTLL